MSNSASQSIERSSEMLASLKKAGLRPSAIFDVGANAGEWTSRALAFFPEATYTLFEPQLEMREPLEILTKRSNVQWLHCGVSDQIGREYLTIAPRSDSSSFILRADQAEAMGLQQVMVEMTTLDKVVADKENAVPDILKIDTEGYDLKVLNGARSLLGKTEVILVEAAICAPNLENTALAVMNQMDEFGYKLVDITHLNANVSTGFLWLSELVFLRKDSFLLPLAQAYEA